eukprot:6976786-Prymnesium_polylepis.1
MRHALRRALSLPSVVPPHARGAATSRAPTPSLLPVVVHISRMNPVNTCHTTSDTRQPTQLRRPPPRCAQNAAALRRHTPRSGRAASRA